MKKTITLFSLFATMMFGYQASAQISSYCASNATLTGDSKIDSVILNTLVSGSPAATCETYTDNTALSTTLTPGGTYTITVTNGTCGFYYQNYKRAWIDFNQNGQFDDPAERIIDVTTSSLNQSQSATFTVPGSALSGNTFMRVISAETFGLSGCGTYAYGETEDYSILIKATAENDAAVLAVTEPTGGCEGTYDVKAQIANLGINKITTVDVNWSINGNPQTPVIYTQDLDTIGALGGTHLATVTMGSITLLGGVADTIKIWTSNPNSVNDTSNANDTVTEIINSIPKVTTYPYIQNFEDGQADWFMGGTNSSWEFGTPSKANIMSDPTTGDSSFVTSLTGNYNTNEESFVGSPCFDLSGFEGEAWVGIDVNWYSESSYDGAVLQTSVDGGNSWQNVGAFGDPFNWYNRENLVGEPGGQGDGWAGNFGLSSNGWLKAKHMLDPSLIGQNVRFRVAFGSDGSVQYDGFAFDNFILMDYKRANLGPDQFSLCGQSTLELNPNVNFNGTIAWSTGDTTNEKISITGPGTFSVIYTDTLLDLVSGDTAEIVESTPPAINFVEQTSTIAPDGHVTIDPQTNFELEYEWQPTGLKLPYLLVKGADYGVGTHTFQLTVTDSLLCTDNKTAIVKVVTYIGAEEHGEAVLNFYPNPVQDELNVQLNGFDKGQIEMEIIDIQGKVLISNTTNHTENQTYTMNLDHLTSGIYFLSVRSETKSTMVKVVVK